MLTTNDVAKVYDTILSIPGMNETVKIDMRILQKYTSFKCGNATLVDNTNNNEAE